MWCPFGKNPLATFDQPPSLTPTIPEKVSYGRSEIMVSGPYPDSHSGNTQSDMTRESELLRHVQYLHKIHSTSSVPCEGLTQTRKTF